MNDSGEQYLLCPLPGFIRVSRDGQSCDKPMSLVGYINHVRACLHAISQMAQLDARS